MVENVNAKFLFIGGAPRSGTTLLVNLLDSHPDILAFPSEHSTIEKYFWNKDNIKQYALTDFIFKRSEGQQTILASGDLLKQYSEKIKKEYNKEYSLDVDSKAFSEAYISFLKNKEISLKEILSALMYALSESNGFAAAKYSNAKYFVFKQPYFTDLFAKEVCELIPDAKFINIQRDPISRYASAKKRRISLYSQNSKKLIHVNLTNFVEAHAEVDISSFYTSKDNQEFLGVNTYKIIKYENVLNDPSPSFEDIFSWLSVKNADCYLNPTLLGKKAFAGSTMINKVGIDKSASNRNTEYNKITSWNERLLHKHYLIKGNLLNENPRSIYVTILCYLLPFKFENALHYLYKISKISRLFKNKEIRTRLSEGAKKKKYFISGAI